MEAHLKEKYYQPNISEFCVGFEWEYHNALGKDFGKWTKEVVKNDASLFHVNSLLATGAIRVKYLDKQDIESCGFNYIGKINWYYIFEKEGIRLKYNENSNHLMILIIDIKSFDGIIKNLSELKKLLKQLGI